MRRPEEILAFRPLKQVLDAKPRALWAVAPGDNVHAAMQIMADKNIGFLVVLEASAMVGVISERDCARRVVLGEKASRNMLVGEIMIRQVVTAEMTFTFADCLQLMHRHGVRHLPVLEGGKPVGVVSIRDLLAEAVAHHAKIIAELERERLTIFTSTA